MARSTMRPMPTAWCAAGEDAGAGRRAQRGGVEVGVAEAAAGEGVEVRRVDVGAVTAELGEAHVVEHHEDDVGRAGRRPRLLGPPRLRLPVVPPDAPPELARF